MRKRATGPVTADRKMAAKGQRIARYTRSYQEDYTFESVMVSARQRAVLDTLEALQPGVVVEVGCGVDLLVDRALSADLPFRQWLVVEPSREFADVARAAKRSSPAIDVIEAFVEDSIPQILDACLAPPDLVICSGVLHEVADPGELLRAMQQLVATGGGTLHVNVPNANSLHRRLARAMGLIPDEHELTERNRELEQFRVYDQAVLRSQVEAAGFRVESAGGYFLKPFTHEQMDSLSFLTQEMLDGLWVLGDEMPELASELYVTARSS